MSVEGVHALVRRTHEERVLRVLREHGALSRGQIAAKVGLSRTTLSEIAGAVSYTHLTLPTILLV